MEIETNKKVKFKLNPVLKFFLIIIPSLVTVYFLCYYGFSSYLQEQKKLAAALDNGIRLYNAPSNINKNISSVKRQTLTLIKTTHAKINDEVCYNHTPSEEFWKSCDGLSKKFDSASEDESWKYLKFDLQRVSINFKDAYETKNIDDLIICHRILHDLDNNLFNRSSDPNNNSEVFHISAAYDVSTGFGYDISKGIPPAGK